MPTPALATFAFARKIPSLMVTGSHIPDDRNGIKFHRAAGEVLKDDEAGMSRQPTALDPAQFDAAGALRAAAPLPPVHDVEDGFLRRYLDFFGPDALKGLTVGLYQHSAVGREVIARILAALGAEVVPLGRSDTFIPVDTEALRPEDVALAADWAKTRRFDALASTDGDSDRPLLSDAAGRWLRGDILGVLCARELKADTVVTPVSSNTALEKCGAFAHVARSRIGSPYVIKAMQTGTGIVCGFEANGGFLLGSDVVLEGRRLSALPTRDSVLPILAVLAAARRRPIAELAADLPPRVTYSDRIKEFPTADSQAILAFLTDPAQGRARIEAAFAPLAGALAGVDLTDGLRMTFADGAVIHLRPSGNAPELRCYTETADEASAQALNLAALKLVRDRLAAAARA